MWYKSSRFMWIFVNTVLLNRGEILMKKITWLFCLPMVMMAGELKDALIQAKKAHQPMMVYVKSDSCQYCNKMKNNTLNDASVLKNTSDFFFIVADKNDAEAKKYLPNTRYTPTVYFISPEFKVVNMVKGYLGKDDFNLWINDSKEKLGMNSTVAITSETTSYVSDDESNIWMYDMPSAIDYASQSGKQVMLYIYSSNDQLSDKMIKNTFTNSSVKEALENFVWVKIQKESPEVDALGLKPKYVPTVYFMRANKSILATAEGYFDSDDFILWINHAKSKI